MLSLKEKVKQFCIPEQYSDEINYALSMLNAIINNSYKWPIDKTSRWLGFAQAELVRANIITIDSEREETRKIFHDTYRKIGIFIPETFEINSVYSK